MNDEQVEKADLSTEEMQRLLLQIQLQRLLEEEEQRQEHRRRLMEIRRMTLEEMKHSEEQRLLAQERCTHLKQNGESALAGQRDHAGRPFLVCQVCGKLFGPDQPIPYQLRVPAEALGGPETR